MSTLLSPSPVAVDIEHSSDHHDTTSKPFSNDSASPSSSPSSPASPNKKTDSHREQSPNTPPRPSAPEPASPEPSFIPSDASPNGHASELNEDEIPQVPSQAPTQIRDELHENGRQEHGSRAREGSDREEAMMPAGSEEDEGDLGSGESDGDWGQDDFDAEMRRVKVYELVGQKWTDRGTAFCQGDYDEELREAKLVARSEISQEVLLQCTIRATDVYQRQQETLIVWTEPDGTDFALSFQDVEGCAEVWDFIVEVQRHLQSKMEEDGDSSEPGNSSMHMFTSGAVNPFLTAPKLPTPALGNMEECERVIRGLSRQPRLKEKLTDLIIMHNYVQQVIEISQQAEDLENLKELHACCSCMQAILLINDITIYDYVVQDSLFMGVLGVLEYDPEFPTHKAQYRDFLQSTAKFREPIPIRDPQVRSKIHMTYRLQLLKDFILARATDDATFNILNSNIAFNQIEICNSLQNDERFLREAVGLFLTPDTRSEKGKDKEGQSKSETPNGEVSKADSSTTPEEPPPPDPPAAPTGPSQEYTLENRRKDTILLIHQLCLMGKNIQLPARMSLFRCLVDRSVLHMVQWALGRSEPAMLSAAGEILGIILDHDVIGVRQHVMRQSSMVDVLAKSSLSGNTHGKPDAREIVEIMGARKRTETLLEALVKCLVNGHDQAFRSQMADALRTVLEVPQADGGLETNATILRGMARQREDPANERFIEHFYGKCAEPLFRPLAELPECSKVTERVLQLSRDRSNLYLYLCDLLSAFLLQHSFRSHFFIVSTANALPPLIPRIASLLKAKEKHVRLASLRFFRACLKLNNRNLFNQLIKHEVFLPILELTAREAPRDNLLSSCCQEFFEHIRRENFKEVIAHIMTRYDGKVQELSRSPVCGERFQALIRRWEINCEPPPVEVETAQPIAPAVRKWGQGRLLDTEEEEYFNQSDEEETPKAGPSGSSPVSPLGSANMLKRKRGKGFISAARTPKQLRPLVDYEDDDDDQPGNIASSSKGGEKSSPSPAPTESPPPPKRDWFAGLNEAPPSPSLAIAAKESNTFESTSTSTDLGPSRPESPPRLGEKRRRDDDEDEDELLERLVRSKRPSVGPAASEKEEASKPSPKTAASGGKMKVKLSFAPLGGSPSSEKKDEGGGGGGGGGGS